MRLCSKISILQYCILLDCCCSLYLDSANFVLNCAVVRDGTGGLAMESADCPTRFRCGGIGDNQPLTGIEITCTLTIGWNVHHSLR